MKKISILGLALIGAFAATAQVQTVKDVENQLKKDVMAYPNAIKTLTLAFTNPETDKLAQTWYVAGKGAFDYVNQANAMSRITKETNYAQWGQFVIDGYEYLLKALPLDSVADAKGKIKTKYSKDILKTLVNNYPLAQEAGLWFYNDVKDYPKAAKAWSYIFTLPENPAVIKAGLKVLPDSVLGAYRFYSGCANSLANDYAPALNDFEQAIKLGYKDKAAYDYAITAATQLKEYDKAANIAKAAYAHFPEPNYLGTIINNKLEQKDYDGALTFLDPYIQAEPSNGALYYLKGVIMEQKGDNAQAKQMYSKAIEFDANNANALFRYALKICEEADALDQNESTNMTQAEYDKFCQERTFPMYREAAQYLEKAFQVDENLTDCLTLLRSIYYKLNDEANLKRVNEM